MLSSGLKGVMDNCLGSAVPGPREAHAHATKGSRAHKAAWSTWLWSTDLNGSNDRVVLLHWLLQWLCRYMVGNELSPGFLPCYCSLVIQIQPCLPAELERWKGTELVKTMQKKWKNSEFLREILVSISWLSISRRDLKEVLVRWGLASSPHQQW